MDTTVSDPLSTTPPRHTRLSIPVAGGTAVAVIDLANEPLGGGSAPCLTISEQIRAIGAELEALQCPEIEVIRDGVQLRFRRKCPWCRDYHWHGAHSSCHPGADECPCPRHPDYHHSRGICLCPLGSADGHRGAHCWAPGSPYRRTGYILREVPR